jgi:Fe2+ transport system protein FeoA
MVQKQSRPLSTVRSGEKVKIVKIEAGRGLNSRLVSMGLVPNTQITVINSVDHGPLVIMVKESKIMLGRGMANKITVM